MNADSLFAGHHIENQRTDDYVKGNLCKSFWYGRLTFQKSRSLDILGWPPPGGRSLLLYRTVVERQARFQDDPSGARRTGSKFLADVEELA